MRTLPLGLAALALALALAPAIVAQEPPAPAREPRGMARLDANGDGLISKDEWKGNSELFGKLDVNGDGKLDTVEIAAAKEKIKDAREKLEERRGQRRGPEAPGGPEGQDADKVRQRVYGAAMFAGGLFNLIDSDKDGKLSGAELDNFTAKIKEADTDKDGFVTKDEARLYFRKRLAQRIGEAFMKKLDANSDGKVTREEFKGSDKRFQWLDANKDGVITIEDFEKRGPAAFERKPGEGKGPGKGEGRPEIRPRRERPDNAPPQPEAPKAPDKPAPSQ